MQKIFTQKGIQDVAKEVLKKVAQVKSVKSVKLVKSLRATIIALSGDLGAGKTTLTQAIARELGVKENIISPTFVILKSYQLKAKNYKLLHHIDAYRLDSAQELLKLGWKELLADSKNLILIEWPEKVAELIPKDAILVSLSHEDENTRQIDISYLKSRV